MGLVEKPIAWTGIPLKAIPESEVQSAAVALLKAVGWAVFVDRVAWQSDPGWLDLYATHPVWRRTVYVEVKKEDGVVSPSQEAWIAIHQAAGNEVMVLRPSNWEEFVRFVVHPEMIEGVISKSPISPLLEDLRAARALKRRKTRLPKRTPMP